MGKALKVSCELARPMTISSPASLGELSTEGDQQHQHRRALNTLLHHPTPSLHRGGSAKPTPAFTHTQCVPVSPRVSGAKLELFLSKR